MTAKDLRIDIEKRCDGLQISILQFDKQFCVKRRLAAADVPTILVLTYYDERRRAAASGV
jgi:hypothetical protein